LLNHLPVTGLSKQAGRIDGLVARDGETGEEFTIKAKAVINAAGVFVDELRRLDDAHAPAILAPSQGAHLVLDRSFLPGASALLVPRTDDGRVLFAIPWHDRVLVGTTDTPMTEVAVEPRPLHEEVAYLVDYVGRCLDRRPQTADILSTYAGLRPLIAGSNGRVTSKLSREHAVVVSDSGLVTVTGGKWTTYRRMAIDAVDQAARVGSLPARPSSTALLKLHGWKEPVTAEDGPLAVYGSDAQSVAALCGTRSEWNEPLHSSLPYRTGEVIWAARYEAARSVQDVLARRTRALFLNARASIEAAAVVADVLASELGRDQAWTDRQLAEYRALAAGYLPAS
jgi:glycerol-3-phosphate dehydrogenase